MPRHRLPEGAARKVVLITGASSGFGRITTELMAERGWMVAATARDPAALTWVGSPRVATFRLDVADDQSIAAAVSAVVDHFGRIDVLVNNAGFGLFGPLEGATDEQVALQLRTNVTGVVALMQRVMPIMRSQGGGTIVNVSSIGGRVTSPFASLYHASKFAIEGLSESFRYEASLHNVRVKLVEPAHFKTGFISRSLLLVTHEAYERPLRNYMEWVHLEDERAPAPGPVARAILRAAEDPSPRLRYPVRGSVILALAKLLPDVVWRSLLSAGMTRRPKHRVERPESSAGAEPRP